MIKQTVYVVRWTGVMYSGFGISQPHVQLHIDLRRVSLIELLTILARCHVEGLIVGAATMGPHVTRTGVRPERSSTIYL